MQQQVSSKRETDQGNQQALDALRSGVGSNARGRETHIQKRLRQVVGADVHRAPLEPLWADGVDAAAWPWHGASFLPGLSATLAHCEWRAREGVCQCACAPPPRFSLSPPLPSINHARERRRDGETRKCDRRPTCAVLSLALSVLVLYLPPPIPSLPSCANSCVMSSMRAIRKHRAERCRCTQERGKAVQHAAFHKHPRAPSLNTSSWYLPCNRTCCGYSGRSWRWPVQGPC